MNNDNWISLTFIELRWAIFDSTIARKQPDDYFFSLSLFFGVNHTNLIQNELSNAMTVVMWKYQSCLLIHFELSQCDWSLCQLLERWWSSIHQIYMMCGRLFIESFVYSHSRQNDWENVTMNYEETLIPKIEINLLLNFFHP